VPEGSFLHTEEFLDALDQELRNRLQGQSHQ
jgi:hypothetical protein